MRWSRSWARRGSVRRSTSTATGTATIAALRPPRSAVATCAPTSHAVPVRRCCLSPKRPAGVVPATQVSASTASANSGRTSLRCAHPRAIQTAGANRRRRSCRVRSLRGAPVSCSGTSCRRIRGVTACRTRIARRRGQRCEPARCGSSARSRCCGPSASPRSGSTPALRSVRECPCSATLPTVARSSPGRRCGRCSASGSAGQSPWVGTSRPTDSALHAAYAAASAALRAHRVTAEPAVPVSRAASYARIRCCAAS